MCAFPPLAWRFYQEAPLGSPVALPKAGFSTEHPLVFDRVARDLLGMADSGLVEIVEQHRTDVAGDGQVVDHLVFRRCK